MEEMLMRFWTNLQVRFHGPMTFRLILQPTLASILAIRAGLNDAREGRPPYLWTILTDRSQRGKLIREGWRATVRVFGLAVVSDFIHQWIAQRWIYPGEALMVALILAVMPYLILRGPVNRLARRFGRSRNRVRPRSN